MAQVLGRAALSLIWQQHQFKQYFLSPRKPTTASSFSLLTTPFRDAHFPSRGLRLPRESDPPPETSVSDDEKKRRSRNEMKREARQAVRWGMDLASFPPPQIKRILKAASPEMEGEVYEAIMVVKRFGSDVREGKRRQFNYIGKLLRDAQPDLLSALIQAAKDGDQSRFQALAGSVESVDESDEEEFHQSESEQEHEDTGDHLVLASKWYDGLINKDLQISNEIYSVDSVDFDRQELRRLVRQVHYAQDRPSDDEDDKSRELMAAKRSLNRFLNSLAKRLSS